MWRERLGRQQAQAEAVELRIKVSEHQAAAGSSLSDAGLDEAVMESLERVRSADTCLGLAGVDVS